MNTTAQTPTADTRPDYEIARMELNALFETLCLKAEISGAHVATDDSNWDHVAVTVTIKRGAMQGRPPVSVSFPYSMGLGLANWKGVLARTARGDNDYPLIRAMAGLGSLHNEHARNLAAKHLPSFVRRVNPAEVLAGVCRDAQDATDRSFADWASDYGYDTDSRKAERIYLACQEEGHKARKLIDAATAARLAELAARL